MVVSPALELAERAAARLLFGLGPEQRMGVDVEKPFFYGRIKVRDPGHRRLGVGDVLARLQQLGQRVVVLALPGERHHEVEAELRLERDGRACLVCWKRGPRNGLKTFRREKTLLIATPLTPRLLP